MNVLVVVGSERLYSDMLRHFSGQRMGTDTTTTVIKLDRSGGSVNCDEEYLGRYRQAQVREYFFGDSKVALSPHTQQVDFSQFAIYRVPECKLGISSRVASISRADFCVQLPTC